MEFPTFEKTINNHEMSIHFHGNDDEVTEAALWCRTCDPEGKNEVVRTTHFDNLPNDVRELMAVAEEHASD